MRRDIEQSVGKLSRAYDIYGLTEISGPGVSFECEEEAGMHVQEDHFIPEIINPDTGEVLPEGEVGELVFTCITKKGFPTASLPHQRSLLSDQKAMFLWTYPHSYA